MKNNDIMNSNKYQDIKTQNLNDDPKSTQKWFCSGQSLDLNHVTNLSE